MVDGEPVTRRSVLVSGGAWVGVLCGFDSVVLRCYSGGVCAPDAGAVGWRAIGCAYFDRMDARLDEFWIQG